MAQSNIPRAQTVPEFWKGNEEEHLRKISTALNQLFKGISNNHYTVTLETDATSTEVMHPPVRPGTAVQLTPGSAEAAVAMASGLVWVETESGKAIIKHDSSVETGRIFHLTFSG